MLGDIMESELFIEDLFMKLQDKMEFDEDVEALFKILKNLLKTKKQKSIDYWLILMKKYNLKELSSKIDFSPLTKEYLLELLKTENIDTILKLINSLPQINKKWLKENFINIFNENSGIYIYIENLIKEKEKEEEKEINVLKAIIKENEKNKLTFDTEIFLKKVILKHLKMNQINLPFLFQITDLALNEKDKLLLKSLLIDYIE